MTVADLRGGVGVTRMFQTKSPFIMSVVVLSDSRNSTVGEPMRAPIDA